MGVHRSKHSMRTVVNNSLQQCPICSKRFISSVQLNQHIATHTHPSPSSSSIPIPTSTPVSVFSGAGGFGGAGIPSSPFNLFPQLLGFPGFGSIGMPLNLSQTNSGASAAISRSNSLIKESQKYELSQTPKSATPKLTGSFADLFGRKDDFFEAPPTTKKSPTTSAASAAAAAAVTTTKTTPIMPPTALVTSNNSNLSSNSSLIKSSSTTIPHSSTSSSSTSNGITVATGTLAKISSLPESAKTSPIELGLLKTAAATASGAIAKPSMKHKLNKEDSEDMNTRVKHAKLSTLPDSSQKHSFLDYDEDLSDNNNMGFGSGGSSGSGSGESNPLDAIQRMWKDAETTPPARHPVALSKHQCGVCFKHFSSSSALQIHMRTHTGSF
uniref:C2H2-type domain-containing protein n=2 Tax=Panagrolaimus superbus TaxID=310955 RepID=A0A914Y3B6_9BILA